MKECQWCGMTHGVRCPAVKAIEYHENGAIKRVEFLTPGDNLPPLLGTPWPVSPLPVPGQPQPPWQIPLAPTVTW